MKPLDGNISLAGPDGDGTQSTPRDSIEGRTSDDSKTNSFGFSEVACLAFRVGFLK